MYEYWITPTTNVMYTRSQDLTYMVGGGRGIQIFELVFVVLLILLLLFLSPRMHNPLSSCCSLVQSLPRSLLP